jgi:type I restriction enzyme S subunit
MADGNTGIVEYMNHTNAKKGISKPIMRRVPALRFSEFAGGSAGVSKGGASRVRDAAAVGLKWEEKKLGDLLSFKNGVNASKEKYGRGHRFINVLDIIENDYLTHERIRGSVDISDADFEKNKVEYGDILFQRSSETREEVGQANVYLDERVPATFGGFVIMGKKIGDYHPTFLNYLLRTSSVREDMTSRSGGSTRYNIGQESLKKVPITVPELPEQEKIAGFLGAVDEWIGTLREEHSALETYKRGLMQGLFSQTIRFRNKNGKDFPLWEEKKLGEIADVYQPQTISQADLKKEGYLVYGANGVIGKYDKFNHEMEQVVVTCRGNTCGEVGLTKSKVWITGNAMVVNVDESVEQIDKQFLYYLLKSSDLRYLITGSGQPQITGDIKKHRILLPCIEEQKKIADFLTALDEVITAKADEIAKAEEWKKGLMQKMFV